MKNCKYCKEKANIGYTLGIGEEKTPHQYTKNLTFCSISCLVKYIFLKSHMHPDTKKTIIDELKKTITNEKIN